MQTPRHLALLVALLSAFGTRAYAQDEAANTPITEGTTIIDGQRMEIYLDRKMSAIGDAELHQNGQDVYGDRINYDVLNEELHVIGNAKIVQGNNTMTGPELRMRLDEREGEMKEAVFTMRSTPKAPTASTSLSRASKTPAPTFSRGSARRVTFDGPDKETLEGARYTTCEAGVDDWYLRAEELKLDHYTETGTAKHASIEFKGVPIMYTPWIDFPFNSQRKTGFLAPTWGTTTRSGFELAVPFYWNIAPNMDATITPRMLSRRGLQTQGNFRYLNEFYSGEDTVEYLPDDQMTGQNRFFAKLKHNHNFNNGWTGGFDLERVSDGKYFSDLSTRIVVTSRINMKQEGFLNYAGSLAGASVNLNGLVQQYQTLDNVSFPYQRLPQLTLNSSKDWDVVIGNLYSQWVRFDTSDRNPNKNKVATGNRFIANPSLSLPMGRPYGFVTPKLGFHYTSYSLDNTDVLTQYDSDQRSIPTFSVDSGMFFERDFRVVKNKYTQTLEPRLFYVYVPYHNQSNLPVFDTGQADLNMTSLFAENLFVGGDRISDANQLSFAVTSRLLDAKTGQQRLAATIGQRYYFSDQKVTLPGVTPRTSNSSDLLVALTARLLNNWNVDAGWQYNTDIDRMERGNIMARYQPEPGKVLNMGYRFTREKFNLAGVEQIDVSTEWPLSKGWYALGRVNYSFLDNRATERKEDGLIEGLAGVEYDAGCWQARGVMQRVATATANANYAFFFQLELGGIASIGTSPLSLLQRSIPGYRSTALIPDNPQ